MSKCFQIWIGSSLRKNDKLKIDNNKSLFNEHTLFRDKSVGKNKALIEVEVTALKNPKTKWLLEQARNPQEQNDILRLSFMMNNPDYWYLDTDAELLEIPDTENGRPYFAEYKKSVDGFIIYGNNNSNAFKMIINDIFSKVKAGYNVALAQHEVIRRQVNKIDKKFFKHQKGA